MSKYVTSNDSTFLVSFERVVEMDHDKSDPKVPYRADEYNDVKFFCKVFEYDENEHSFMLVSMKALFTGYEIHKTLADLGVINEGNLAYLDDEW